MALDFEESVTRALRDYVRHVSVALGLSGECSVVQAEPPASAYLAVDGHLPGFPDSDVALLWDERHGWSAAVEVDSGDDPVVRARLGGDVLPSPQVVAKWLGALLRGDAVLRPAPRQSGDLARRLSAYVTGELSPVEMATAELPASELPESALTASDPTASERAAAPATRTSTTVQLPRTA